jgi:hypothetical protein
MSLAKDGVAKKDEGIWIRDTVLLPNVFLPDIFLHERR